MVEYELDGKLELEQTQFLSSGSEGVGQWVVPNSHHTMLFQLYSVQQKLFFLGKQEDFNLSGLVECQKKDDFWIKLNIDQTGLYRVSYDGELASRHRHAVETNTLSARDRYAKTLAWFLTTVQVFSYSSILTLLPYDQYRCT